MTLFDAYVPTRTGNSVEVRVRSASKGPVVLHLEGDACQMVCANAPDNSSNRVYEAVLDEPAVSHRGLHFFRHTFSGLSSGIAVRVHAVCRETNARALIDTSTLALPTGPPRLRIGLLADLHLTPDRTTIDHHRPGQRRLLGLGWELFERYVRRLETLGADAFVLLGDLVEPCTASSVSQLRAVLSGMGVPCYPIIGNHEPWTEGGEEVFYRGLGLPNRGYYAVTIAGVRLVMLSTPSPAALRPGSAQYRWLEAELESARSLEVLLFSHFSLLLHPCVAGPRNDDYQVLDSSRALLELLSRYPNVRVFSAGHKNVPSMVVNGHTVHLLSPQLIQAPCAFDLLSLYQDGVARFTYEIDEQHYVEVARAAYEDEWALRYGAEGARNFWVRYPGGSG